MLIRPAIGDTDPIRCRRPSPDGQFSGNILDEAMRPFERRVLAVALAPSELAGVAETARARVVLIVVAAFEAPAVVAGLDDVAVVGEAVEQRGRHLGVAEHARPFTEGEIGGDDDRGALVEPADEVEQELAAGLGERQIAEFIEDDEVHAGQMIGDAGPAVRCGSRSRAG